MTTEQLRAIGKLINININIINSLVWLNITGLLLPPQKKVPDFSS